MSNTDVSICVVGANGFIGSQIVYMMRSSSSEIYAFDRFTARPFYESDPGIKLLKGDVCNRSDIMRIPRVNVVIHSLWLSNPASGNSGVLFEIDLNLKYLTVLLDHCVEVGVERFVFISSAGAVYGDTDVVCNESSCLQPCSSYGLGKVMAENIVEYYGRVKKLDYVILRVSNPFGPTQKGNRGQGLIPVIHNSLLANRQVTLFSAEALRDYIFIDDLVKVIEFFVFKKSLTSRVVNVCSSVSHSNREVYEMISDLLGKHIQPKVQDRRPADVNNVLLSNDLLKHNYSGSLRGLSLLLMKYTLLDQSQS